MNSKLQFCSTIGILLCLLWNFCERCFSKTFFNQVETQCLIFQHRRHTRRQNMRGYPYCEGWAQRIATACCRFLTFFDQRPLNTWKFCGNTNPTLFKNILLFWVHIHIQFIDLYPLHWPLSGCGPLLRFLSIRTPGIQSVAAHVLYVGNIFSSSWLITWILKVIKHFYSQLEIFYT